MFIFRALYVSYARSSSIMCHTRRYCTRTILSIIEDSKLGDEVIVQGWAKSVRKMKGAVFIDVADGTGEKLQVMAPKSIIPESLSPGCSLSARGNLARAPSGQLELTAYAVNIVGKCSLEEGYPFAPRKFYSNEYVRQYLHLRSRTTKFASIIRLRHRALLSVHDFMDKHDFVNIHTPVLTSNDCEGAGETFTVITGNKRVLKEMIKDGQSEDEAFFNTKAFLTVSAQLHLEAAAHGLSRVYSLNPTFRAENSRSRLHLAEFYMLEAEQAFVDDISDLQRLIESLIKHVTRSLVECSSEDIKNSRLNEEEKFVAIDSWIDKPFCVLEYSDAISILQAKRVGSIDAEGLTKEQELFLVSHCGGVPCFVINWPKSIKPFYMKKCRDDPQKVAALDLLVPNVGELVGGSLRENNYDKLRNNIPQGVTNLNWYLDLRKFGGVPTAGFGLGFERFLQFLLGISNIKDTIPYPRWPHNCSL